MLKEEPPIAQTPLMPCSFLASQQDMAWGQRRWQHHHMQLEVGGKQKLHPGTHVHQASLPPCSPREEEGPALAAETLGFRPSKTWLLLGQAPGAKDGRRALCARPGPSPSSEGIHGRLGPARAASGPLSSYGSWSTWASCRLSAFKRPAGFTRPMAHSLDACLGPGPLPKHLLGEGEPSQRKQAPFCTRSLWLQVSSQEAQSLC